MDPTGYLRFLLSLTAVIGLIFAASWVLRKYGIGLAAARPIRGSSRRLGVVESLPLDAKRRLILVRRDDREHLLLLGIDGDLMVEADCQAPRFSLPSQPEPAP